MAIVLLLIVVLTSSIIVRISAFALELTGLPWDQAKFQALSAFTNSGYTTREAEGVTQHPVRRRIVSGLMVFGNAGIVTTIGTFAGTVISLDIRKDWPVLVITSSVFVLFFLLARWDALMDGIRRVFKRVMASWYDFQPPRVDELLRLDQGYGLARIEITDKSPVVGKALQELGLKDWLVQILAIERGPEYKPVPSGKERLLPGDAVIVYGADDAIYKVFRPRTSTRLTVLGV